MNIKLFKLFALVEILTGGCSFAIALMILKIIH
jgi:hypothetical protein